MANNCYFEMKIAGPEKAVEEFVRMLRHEGPGYGLGRVFSFDLTCPGMEERDPATGHVAIQGAGDCAWSLKSSLLNCSPTNLTAETKRLGLAVEAYSSEPGCCFQEHILVVNDELLIHDVVDYEEYWLEGQDDEYIQEIADQFCLTREELMRKVDDNGDYCIGGFRDFGDFRDLFHFLAPERKPSLADRIANAETQAAAQKEPSEEKGREAARTIDV